MADGEAARLVTFVAVQKPDKIQVSRMLMIATIIILAGFQVYWLVKLYEDEKKGLRKEADVLFKSAMYNLQMNKLRKDSLFHGILPQNVFLLDAVDLVRRSVAESTRFRNMLIEMKATYKRTGSKDSAIMISEGPAERVMLPRRGPAELGKVLFRSSLGDSLSIATIDSVYRRELKKAGIDVSFQIVKKKLKGNIRQLATPGDEQALHTGFIPVGLAQPVMYQAQLSDTFEYLVRRIVYPILVSLLLITLTTATFVFLYRNLVAQRRLTILKNDFISNITHELKTPIATVNVAIEALRNFNAIDNPERTKEYLDISASELQRLSLLVDKVLKLSLFENKEIELKLERFNLRQLTEEVVKTMQLQLQKKKAVLGVRTEGEDFMIEADKLHITSVIYNLLDNALKYSPVEPRIEIALLDQSNKVVLSVKDNGIGIPAEYREKIFEKFFRVPHGNTHDIKGYGLGLSYVHHVVQKHGGSIEVESETNNGSRFMVRLQKQL